LAQPDECLFMNGYLGRLAGWAWGSARPDR